MIRVRFAPSPTGMLHIGGARTALFNYIFAKANNGKFLLRIEDTDFERSTQASVDAIFDGLNWLGIKSDEEVVFQSKNQNRHKELAKKLIENGLAYYAYDTKEELDEKREKSENNGIGYKYDGKWRDSNLEIPKNIDPVVRIKIPNEKIIVNDVIKGSIEFDSSTLDDFIILRSDGTPTYMFAVVVDDMDMKITHVIRGDDHLSNTPKQMVIYKALGVELPNFAHIPLIHGEDGKKLSKRRNAVAVADYAQLGILPEALKMYLLSLGWSCGSDIITEQMAVEKFKLEDVVSSPARFDMQKLYNINLHFIQGLSSSQLIKEIENIDKISISKEQIDILEIILPELKKNNNIIDIAKNAQKYIHQDTEMEQDAITILEERNEIAKKIATHFTGCENFSNFKDDWSNFLKENNLKFPEAGPVFRAMLIGCTNSTALGAIISALPTEVIHHRISKFL